MAKNTYYEKTQAQSERCLGRTDMKENAAVHVYIVILSSVSLSH